RSGIQQFMATAPNDFLNGPGILAVVEVAEHNQINIGIGREQRVDPLPQDFGLFEPQIRLVRAWDGAPGFEMRRYNRERVIRTDLDLCLGETATYPEAPAIQQEVLVRMRSQGCERKPAQQRNMDIGIKSGDPLRKLQVQAIGLQ